jgi:hypothetical protein
MKNTTLRVVFQNMIREWRNDYGTSHAIFKETGSSWAT